MQLGEVLALIHSAPDDLAHGHIVYLDRVTLPPSSAVDLERDEAGTLRLQWHGPGRHPDELGMRRLIWFARPDRIRVEFWESGALRRLLVQRGARWWRWDAHAGISDGEIVSKGDAEAAPPLLDPPALAPYRLLAFLILCPKEIGMCAGRRVISVTGTPRARLPPPEPVRHHLEFDAEYGIVMRHAVYVNGARVSLTEATELSHNPAPSAERFVFNPPSGVAAGAP